MFSGNGLLVMIECMLFNKDYLSVIQQEPLYLLVCLSIKALSPLSIRKSLTSEIADWLCNWQSVHMCAMYCAESFSQHIFINSKLCYWLNFLGEAIFDQCELSFQWDMLTTKYHQSSVLFVLSSTLGCISSLKIHTKI